MRYLLALTTVDDPQTMIIEVAGLLPVDDTCFPLTLKASCDGCLLTIEDIDQLVIIDRGETIPHDGKKQPEVELITHIGSQRQTIFARTYKPDYSYKIPKVTGVTVKGNPFEIHNCTYTPLTIF